MKGTCVPFTLRNGEAPAGAQTPRRFTNGTADVNDTVVGLTTDRGYTEHEMLDELGIIHMNGRIYDPTIGRFMSADPYIQAPYELQSHNRYAYVMNNPLLYTDPSGYSWWTKFRDNVIKPIAVIVISYYTGGLAGGGFWGAVAGGAAGGAAGAALNGGNLEQVLKGAAVGGFSAALFYGAGNIGQSYGQHGVAHYAAHAIAGCVSSVAGGGQCGSGAASALVGLGVTEVTAGSHWNTLTRGIAVSAAGGVGSMISGGSFASGARTAAYGYLFNELLHEGNRRTAMQRSGYKESIYSDGTVCNGNGGSPCYGGSNAYEAGVSFVSISASEVIGGYSVTLSQDGILYFGVNTGNMSAALTGGNVGLAFGSLDLRDLQPDQRIKARDDFLAGGGGQITYGTFAIGAGSQFSDGRTAKLLLVGSPSFPNANGGYGWRVMDTGIKWKNGAYKIN